MRKDERRKKKKADRDKPSEMLTEKEVKKNELGQSERQKLKEIVNKGKLRPGSGIYSSVGGPAKNADKIA